MEWDADDGVYGLDQDCPLHGDEFMVECRMCGAEYCRSCHPGPRICPTCAEDDGPPDDLDEMDEEEEEDLDPDVAEAIDAEFGDFDDLDEGDELPRVKGSAEED